MARLDPHSYADSAQARTRSFDLSARIDFETRTLTARVTLSFEQPSQGTLDLDTRGLTILSSSVPHRLHPAEPILGSRLELTLAPGTKSVTLEYRTAPDASALQWLEPAQTHGGKQPYLFSQCQAIHARSVVPCQDTPSIRQTYTASLDVPKALRAVMAAAPLGRTEQGERAVEKFEMPQPIPPYLLAFAVGDLASRDLSPRARVYSEPGQLDAAAWEFSGVEAMIHAAESLFGPYDWERFDMLVMPPSFPYGGMENPRLTFLTPALLAGDKSQVNVVAHELAHAWTGNLVTNSTAEHFWLNEGFTVFAENRILEMLEGAEVAALHAAIGRQELVDAFKQFEKQPGLTHLRTKLDGIDPDEAFSQVPYQKGYLFLKTLEQAAGRERFDALLKTWLKTHRFKAATTDDFTDLVEKLEPGLLAKVDAKAWLDAPGLPQNSWAPQSSRLAAVRAQLGRMPEQTEGWTPAEWQLWLEATGRPFQHCAELDARYHLTEVKNPEVLVSWLTLAAESGYAAVLPRIDQVVSHFGRMKYLKPLYRALAANPQWLPRARALYEKLHRQYHPIAQQVIGAIVKT
ncbi:MAG: M1 family metallopeptidase [Archangiaceae bacterium]|nr:M1 family metallopeptidase [Archangiaceae bacterium]